VDIDTQWLKTRGITQGRAFFGSDRWLTTFMGSNFSKTGKMAFYRIVRASENGLKANDVTEE